MEHNFMNHPASRHQGLPSAAPHSLTSQLTVGDAEELVRLVDALSTAAVERGRALAGSDEQARDDAFAAWAKVMYEVFSAIRSLEVDPECDRLADTEGSCDACGGSDATACVCGELAPVGNLKAGSVTDANPNRCWAPGCSKSTVAPRVFCAGHLQAAADNWAVTHGVLPEGDDTPGGAS